MAFARASAEAPPRSSPACPSTTAPRTSPPAFRSRPAYRRSTIAPACSATCGKAAISPLAQPRIADLSSRFTSRCSFHQAAFRAQFTSRSSHTERAEDCCNTRQDIDPPRRDGSPPGFCCSALPVQARVKARRKARSVYGDTSVAGRAGAFRRALQRRSCNAGPRFPLRAVALGGRRPEAQHSLRSRRPKADSAATQFVSQLLAGTRSGPGRSPGIARVPNAYSARGRRGLIQLRRYASRSDP